MNLKDELKKASEGGYALGAFNFFDENSLKAIAHGAKNFPVIGAISQSSFDFIGETFLKALVISSHKEFPNLFFHLDHGANFEICKKCVDMGFDSVMIDASSLPFLQNIAITKSVVDYAHLKNVLVEAELGTLSGIEDLVSGEECFTKANQAKEFVKKTNCDSLAVSIGTKHGAFKFAGTPTLRLDILEDIENLIPNTPIVLHGSSSVNKKLLDAFRKSGGEIDNACGVPENLLINAVKFHHVAKINVDTDLRICFTTALREFFSNNKRNFCPRDSLRMAYWAIECSVWDKIKNVFGVCK
ncbi:MAG: class II fructose-bisphosphate aldolase [Clostridia bacterium]